MDCYTCDRKIPAGVFNPCPDCREEFGITSEIKDGDLKTPEEDPLVPPFPLLEDPSF